MIAQSTRFSPHPEVVHTRLDNGEAVLLHLGTSQYFSLNQTGEHIWELMLEGCSVEEISQQLEAIYDVTLEQAFDCVHNLLDNFCSERLIQPAGT